MKAYEARFKRARARAARAAPRELHAMLSHVCDHVTAEHRDAQEGGACRTWRENLLMRRSAARHTCEAAAHGTTSGVALCRPGAAAEGLVWGSVGRGVTKSSSVLRSRLRLCHRTGQRVARTSSSCGHARGGLTIGSRYAPTPALVRRARPCPLPLACHRRRARLSAEALQRPARERTWRAMVRRFGCDVITLLSRRRARRCVR